MANNTKDVELRIRARDYSQKTFKDLVKVYKSLVEVQDTQAKSAEKGEITAQQLNATYKRLEDSGRALLKLDALTKLYQRQSAALETSAEKAVKAKEKQDELAAAYAKTEKATKRQEQQLGAANRAVEKANKTEESRRKTLANTAKELDRYGISVNDIGGAQKQFAAGVDQINGALERQEKALDGIADNRAAAKLRKDADDERASIEKVIDALSRQADQAIATAKGYRTLGRVVNTTTGTYNALGRQIETIISPADSARRTLKGLEDQINKTASQTTELSKDSKDAREAIRSLGEAQKRLIGISGLVDQFKAQNAELVKSRTEYNRNRAELRELSNALRTSGANHAELGEKIQNAQRRLNESSQALRRQATAARATQSALREAGVQTNKLADEQNRLLASANKSAAATETLSRAMQRQGKNANSATTWTRYFNNENRESLSLYQRVRGEVVAMATAYVGLQGAIDLASGSINAFKTRQQTQIKLANAVAGSNRTVAQEWDYLNGLADTLGVRLEVLSKTYSKFAIATKQAGRSSQETKYIFESVAKAARVFQLSAADTEGVFRALEQIMSKGQVYAEELQGQLGERLPGAVNLLAAGMGITAKELRKQMETVGVVSVETLNFAKQINKVVSSELASATDSLTASEDRLANARFRFNLAMGDAGFIDAYTNMLVKLTAFLESDKGVALAEDLSTVFSAIADSIAWAAENTDQLTAIMGVLVGLKVAKWVTGFAIGIGRAYKDVIKLSAGLRTSAAVMGTATTASKRAAGALGILSTAFRVLLRAVPILGAALIAWDIGSLIYENVPAAKEAIDGLIDAIKELPDTMKRAYNAVTTALATIMDDPAEALKRLVLAHINAIVGLVAKAASVIPGMGQEMADKIEKAFKIDPGEDFFKRTKEAWNDAGKVWDDQQKFITKRYKDELTNRILIGKKAAGQMLQTPLLDPMPAVKTSPDVSVPFRRQEDEPFKFTDDPGTGPTAATRLIDNLTKQFAKLEQQAIKSGKAAREALVRKDLEGRLKLVDEEFAPQMAQVKSIGGDAGEKLVKQLERIIELRKESERLEFQALQSGDSDKRAKRIARLAEEFDKLNAKIQAGQTDVSPDATYEERLSDNLAKLDAQYAKLYRRAADIGGEAGAGFTAQFQALQQLNRELVTQQTKLAEIKVLEDGLSAQLQTKKNLIAEVNSLREAGLITEIESVNRINEINASNNAGLAESITKLETFIMLMRDSLTPEAFTRINAELAAMKAGLADVSGTFTAMDTQVVNGVLGAMETGIDSITKELGNAAAGVQSWGDAFGAIGSAMANFFADFMRKIAQAILQQMLLNALASAGFGGISSAAVSLGGAAAGTAMHNGGIVGDKSSGSGVQSRGSVPASWFAGAPRFHNGGLPGLRSDEVPTILQKGEQVLSKDDPNNILNQKAGGGNGGGGGMSAKFVLVDDRSKVPEAMASPEGDRVITQYLERNKSSVKSILG